MNKVFIVAGLLIIFLSCFSQEKIDTVIYFDQYFHEIPNKENATYYEKRTVDKNTNIPHGSFICYYLSGNVHHQGKYYHGGLKGKVKTYFFDGRLSLLQKYSRRHGRKQIKVYDIDGTEILSKGTGKYKWYNHEGILVTEGWFKNNIEDSLWTSYDHKGRIVESGYHKKNEDNQNYWLAEAVYDSLGNNLLINGSGYVENKRHPFHFNEVYSSEGAYYEGYKKGIWTFYAKNGDTLFQREWDGKGYFEVYPPGLKYPTYISKRSEKASFPGGDEQMNKFILENYKYPLTCIDKKISGQVEVSFYVEVNGGIKDAKIIKPLDPSVDKEVLKLVNSFPKWNPSIEKGEAKRVEVILPININCENITDSSE